MGIFSEKVTVVTGASRGLGKPIAIELAEAGARLACVATRAENAAETVAEIKRQGGEARAFGCHVERGRTRSRACLPR